jgi:hypothetical protein
MPLKDQKSDNYDQSRCMRMHNHGTRWFYINIHRLSTYLTYNVVTDTGWWLQLGHTVDLTLRREGFIVRHHIILHENTLPADRLVTRLQPLKNSPCRGKPPSHSLLPLVFKCLDLSKLHLAVEDINKNRKVICWEWKKLDSQNQVSNILQVGTEEDQNIGEKFKTISCEFC